MRALVLILLVALCSIALADAMDFDDIMVSPVDSLDTLGYPAGYFYIIQGSDTFCVEPYLVDAATESLWFSYSSASMHTGVEEAYKSKAFFFYNPHSGNMGILVVHNVDVTGTTDAWCQMYFIDLPAGSELAVSDDPGEFDLSSWPQGDWEWWNNTDGGAAYLPRAEWKFAIDHHWGGPDPITSWWFLSDSVGSEEIPLSMAVGDTLYLGHGFLQLLPYPSDHITLDSVTTGIDTVIEIVVHNSDETIDTLRLSGVDNTDSHFTTAGFPTVLGPDEWGTVTLNFFAEDTGMYCDTVWAMTNEPCGTNPIIVCVHATAPPVEAEIIEPLPETWTSCEDQQITMSIESGGEQVVRLDVPSNSTTTDYWDTTTSSWKPAVNISYSGWWTPVFEGSSWIWDSVYTGSITGRRLTFQTLIETGPDAIIDSAFVQMYADNSAIFYMNGDSVGADDDGADWSHKFTFDLLPFMHGNVDTMTVEGIDLTGVAVGVDFLVSVFYTIDCDIDPSSIEFTVDGVLHTEGDGFLEYVMPNYLLFTPSGSELFENNDTITACLNNLENFCDGYLANPICWDFYVDLAAPHLENAVPVQDTFIADPLPTITTDIIDIGSGVDESTIEFTVAGSVVPDSELTITSIADGYNIEYTPTEPIMTADTIWVCVSATDSTDYCADNVMDTCWYFFNMSPREVWFPTVFGYPCDTVLIPLEIDGLDYSWIGSADFVFSLDMSVFHPIAIVTTDALTHGWGITGTVIDTVNGTITATVSGTPLSGGPGGDFLYLKGYVPCDAAGGTYTYINIDTIYFNDGVPLVDWSPGLFAVELSPQIFTADIRLNRRVDPTDDYTLTISAYPGGSDGYDAGLDIQQVPPPAWQVSGYFPLDAPSTPVEKLMRDVRAVDPPVTWHLITEDETDGVAKWDPSRFPEGEFRIDGVIDMKRDSMAYFGEDDTLVIEWYIPELDARLLDFEAGWNLVSSPLLPENIPAQQVFLSSYNVYRYVTAASSYSFADFIRDGEGYWVYAESSYTATLIGSEIDGYRRQVYRGWNLIGTTIDTIATTDIDITPSGGIIGDIFGWDGAGYVSVSELIPGNAYWLLSSNDGVLHAPAGYRRRIRPEPLAEWTGKLHLENISLEIGYAPTADREFGPGDVAIPPPEPNSEEKDFYLISGNIRLTRDLSPSGEWQLALNQNASLAIDLPEDVVIRIDGVDYRDGDAAHLSAGVYKIQSRRLLPDKFKVIGAVPNPFNAATDFVIALPEAGVVELEIFDISGRMVREHRAEFNAGTARIRWDGMDDAGRELPSGLYFGRVTFGDESSIIKSMLIK